MNIQQIFKSLLFVIWFIQADDYQSVDVACRFLNFSPEQRATLYALATPYEPRPVHEQDREGEHVPLGRYFPQLAKNIPYVSLRSVESPIEKISLSGEELGAGAVYIKRDDLCGHVDVYGNRSYGGNKLRKLEFLLADAYNRHMSSVLTLGCAGSNHAVATACYAKFMGMHCRLMLIPQPNSHAVRNNLLLMQGTHTTVQLSKNAQERIKAVYDAFIEEKKLHGKYPYFIPTGGSCPLGILGFVNAAFELKQQIEQGSMPVPDYIYVPCGSVGTTVGLIIGLKAAGLPTQVVAVSIEPCHKKKLEEKIIERAHETIAYIRTLDPSFPEISIEELDFILNTDFCGQRYGVYSDEGMHVAKVMFEETGMILDGTYTAKAFAALVHDASEKKLDNKTVLFWNTYCFQKSTDVDYQKLPHAVQRFFIDPVQPLDVQ